MSIGAKIVITFILGLLAISNAQAAPTPISFTVNCKGGGTQATSGTWDQASGAVSVTTTLTACIDKEGRTHNGTVTHSGTLAAGSASNTYTVNLSHAVNTTVSGTNSKNGAFSFTRQCTHTRQGTLDIANDIFTGTAYPSNCSASGTFDGDASLAAHFLHHNTHE